MLSFATPMPLGGGTLQSFATPTLRQSFGGGNPPQGSYLSTNGPSGTVESPKHGIPAVCDNGLLNSLKADSQLFQHVFGSHGSLNTIQQQAFPHAFKSGENMVVSAPTGSGKTG
jgi:hypothetical protein